MAIVIVKDNDVEAALKQLKKKVYQEGTLLELKERRYYKSKGQKRREAKKIGIARQKKREKILANRKSYWD